MAKAYPINIKHLFIIIVFLACQIYVGFALAQTALPVPDEMDYCGVRLKFTPAAKNKLQQLVNQYTKNYVYYKTMVDKASTLMPFIQDGFSAVGVPQDIVYIAIQESGLRGAVVSTSNAVGFWQLKDFTAREVGLRIDTLVDERKHIFRASIGAARYFRKNYARYNNWLYAIISYYEGGTGAKPYTQDRYLGATEMEIDENFHVYALKAIAHKLAYEPGIQAVERPHVFLLPFSNNGELNISNLARQHNLTLDQFREHNLWASMQTLPPDRPFSYYVPSNYVQYATLTDPHRSFFETPQLASVGPALRSQTPAASSSSRDSTLAAAHPVHETSPGIRMLDARQRVEPAPPVPIHSIAHPIQKDEAYGTGFVVARNGETWETLANRHYLDLRKLLKWNRALSSQQPNPGQLVLIDNPRKASAHIAAQHETLVHVAARYRRNAKRLAYLNHLSNPNQLLHKGQKVYLRTFRPRNQPFILYSIPDSLVLSRDDLRRRALEDEQRQQAQAERLRAQQAQADRDQAERLRAQQAQADRQRIANHRDEVERQDRLAQGQASAESHIAVNRQPIVRGGEAERAQTSARATEPAPASGGGHPADDHTPRRIHSDSAYHAVQVGETLYAIARKYGCSVSQLQQWNLLQGTVLRPGQRIRIRPE